MTYLPSLTRGSPARSRGFTLIEVLIAVVILSIGVLGALGMQVNAIRMNKEVRFQSVALTMAKELAEKMRGNHIIAIKTAAADNPYLLATTLNAGTSITAAPVNCYTSQCTDGLDIAKFDIAEWQTRIKEALPSPRVVVCMDSDPFDSAGKPKWACDNNGTVAVLKVAWNRAGTGGTDSGLEFTSEATTLPMLTLPLTAGSVE
jgi:type IV pilus assembly protein PilV